MFYIFFGYRHSNVYKQFIFEYCKSCINAVQSHKIISIKYKLAVYAGIVSYAKFDTFCAWKTALYFKVCVQYSDF